MKCRQRLTGPGPAAKSTTTTSRGRVAPLLVLLLLLAPLSGWAEGGGFFGQGGGSKKLERYVLDFEEKSMQGVQGEPAILFLKKELMRQYPQIDVSAFRLRNLVMMAKTKEGRGSARLRVGPEWSGSCSVAGDPGSFRSRDKQSYRECAITNPYPPSWGPWQLHLQGMFKVRTVVLEVKRRAGHQDG